MRHLLLFSCMFLLFASCQSGKRSADAGDTLRFEMKQWQRTNGQDSNATVSFVYPQLEGKGALQDSVQAQLRVYAFEGRNSPEDFADTFFSQRQQFLRDFPDAPTGWSHDAKASFLANYPGLTTLEVNVSQFTGGVYPNTSRYLLNFNGRGDRIGWKELLNPGQDVFLEKLNGAYLKQDLVRKQILADTAAAWAEAGLLLESGRLLPPASFALLPGQGLLMYYNTSEIAPRVMGDFEYVIPAEKLKGMLKDEWWKLLNGPQSAKQ